MNSYLRTIYRLTDGGEGSTKTSEVAEELDVSDASVSEAVSKLQEEGLVCKADYKGFTLTPVGKSKAKEGQEIYDKLVEYLSDQRVDNPEGEADSMMESMSGSAIGKIISD